MPIEMPKGLPFSVDTWSPCSKRKRHHFLTHAHKDHSIGISTHFSYPIYSTRLTKTLLLQFYHKLDGSLFVGIEVQESLLIEDPDGDFTVTAFDAHHCPGAIMFLFEGNFGNILHTGDCRFTPECLQSLPDKYLGKKGQKPCCQLDYVFLDCTFGKFTQKFPSKHSAIQQVINCIWKHPGAVEVYLACDLLGQEEILAGVSQAFGSKIYFDKANNPECFDALTIIAPEILSQDPSALRFRVLDGFPKVYERARAMIAEAQVNLKPEPLIIRPSAQWYVCEGEFMDNVSQRKLKINEAVKDQFGVWHVCYSMHSSREELECALQLLVPKWVVSTTPNCRATELHYVKKHCLSSQISLNDPVWKLLDINLEQPCSTVKEVEEQVVGSLESEEPTPSRADSQLQLTKISSTFQTDLVNFSPPRKRLASFTLFGKARFGFAELGIQEEEKEKKMNGLKGEDAQEVELPREGEEKSELRLVKKVEEVSETGIGSSKCLNVGYRKFYRSMNVPVPKPLPCLLELMKGRKQNFDKGAGKRRFEF